MVSAGCPIAIVHMAENVPAVVRFKILIMPELLVLSNADIVKLIQINLKIWCQSYT